MGCALPPYVTVF